VKTNLICCGDNLKVLGKFPEQSIDLIYADPPFFSNRSYEVIWGNGAEMKVYEDRWKGGINVYIGWIEPRIAQCHRVLKNTGSIYLHCDWHANAHLRILMDRIFGERNFRNEVVWHYFMGGKAKNFFARKHDTILFYTKSNSYTFNPMKHKRRLDFKPGLEDESKDAKSGQDEFGYYSVVTMDDVWDIRGVFNMSREYQGYRTQKPEALLKRIVQASSKKGDIVLDPFCGCGTTLVAAHELGRKWIGIDVSPLACNLMKARLGKLGVSDVTIVGAPKTIEELKALEPFQFQGWVIERISGVPSRRRSGDMGIDGYTFLTGEPVQVKQSEQVGRDVVDKFETAIRRKHKTAGYIVAFSFTRSAHEEAARARLEDGLDIKLVEIKELDQHFGPG